MARGCSSREWVQCCVLSDQYALVLAAGAEGLRKEATVTLLDAAGGVWEKERRWIVPPGQGLLPADGGWPIRATGQGCAITWERKANAIRVFGGAERFRGDGDLLFDLRLLAAGGGETWAVCPAPEEKGSFHRLSGVLRAEGRAEIGETEYLFAPAHSFGVMETGRGCRSAGRAVAAGKAEGVWTGIVIGAGPEDSMLLWGNTARPLGKTTWRIPGGGDGGPWRVSCAGAELAFEPLAENRGQNRRMPRRGVEEIQIFGRFSGVIRPDGRREIPLRQMAGLVWPGQTDGQ